LFWDFWLNIRGFGVNIDYFGIKGLIFLVWRDIIFSNFTLLCACKIGIIGGARRGEYRKRHTTL
jgi:hypothetical protein